MRTTNETLVVKLEHYENCEKIWEHQWIKVCERMNKWASCLGKPKLVN